MTFELLKTVGQARAGLIHTEHGSFETPIFMPVATKGSVRGLPWETMSELNAEIVLANTYHLHLRPGEKSIERAGGLQAWTKWNKPFLTDSGGFQVFSFAKRGKAQIDEEGVTFKDDLAGDVHRIGPVESMRIQKALGADIVMAFDDCPPAGASFEIVRAAVQRTQRWAQICLEQPLSSHQKLFHIVQGGRFDELRERSLKGLLELNSFGYALGGVSVGESREEVESVIARWLPELPPDKPRYIMGVGTPRDIVFGIMAGADMFDCVLPTRLSRHGSYFGEAGRVCSITRRDFDQDFDSPLLAGCKCTTCLKYSRAYLKHLFLRREITVFHYLAVHNMFSLLNLAQSMRKAIMQDDITAAKLMRIAQLHTNNGLGIQCSP